MREEGRSTSAWHRAQGCQFSVALLLLFVGPVLFFNPTVHAATPSIYASSCDYACSLQGPFLGSTPDAAANAEARAYEAISFYPSRFSIKSCNWKNPLPGMGWYDCPGEICALAPDPYTGMPRWRCDLYYSNASIRVWARCSPTQGAIPKTDGPVCLGPVPTPLPADGCPVEPFPDYTHPPLNTDQLSQRMKDALQCLDVEQGVSVARGNLTIHSAYRPPEYNRHLQQVWDKWVRELRDNNQTVCQNRRDQVGKHFRDHELIEDAQARPHSKSAHTRGEALDLSSSLGYQELDRRAEACQLYRPIPRRDPPHYVHR